MRTWIQNMGAISKQSTMTGDISMGFYSMPVSF